MQHRLPKYIAALAAVAVFAGACAQDDSEPTPRASDTMDSSAAVTSDTPAAELRSGLNNLLSEHVYLAALATGAAFRGETAAFDAWAGQLNGTGPSNSTDIIEAIGAAYGDAAGKAFDPLWRKHIGFVVDYTKATAAKDTAKQTEAVNKLTAYADEFGAFLEGANGLPKATVSKLVLEHITTLKAVIDAQAAKDQVKVYSLLRTAYGHMHMLADPLATATVEKFPEKFDGDPDSKASALRSTINVALREHVLLASSAASRALAGDTAGFTAAADALNGTGASNSTDIVGVITAGYGDAAGKAFDPLWRKHIGFVVDYTKATAAKDTAKQTEAVNKLTAYADEFGAFLEGANGLPKATVSKLVLEHITTLKSVIDDVASKDVSKAAPALRSAVGHMHMLGDPLAEATVKKFPEKFGG